MSDLASGVEAVWRSAAVLGEALERVLLPIHSDAVVEPGRKAAVLLLLYDGPDGVRTVLTRRSDELAHHPGQVALPGGRWETADGDLATTALRETHEEIGVPGDAVRLVGRLADVPTRVSGFIVAPSVGIATRAPAFEPDPTEIARLMEVPVRAVLDLDHALPPDADVVTLRYPLLGEDVWGATARILRAFSLAVRTAAPA